MIVEEDDVEIGIDARIRDDVGCVIIVVEDDVMMSSSFSTCGKYFRGTESK